jgi:putative salt-induced outer membrane protein
MNTPAQTIRTMQIKEIEMRGLKILFLLFFMSIATVASYADEETAAEDKKLKDEFEFSLVHTTGNTEVTTLAAQNTLTYQFTEKWLGEWKIGTLYNESDNDVNAEKYYTDLRLQYDVTERFYSYGIGGWLKDRFSGYDARYYVGPGVGYKFFDGPKHFLAGETGANYVHEELTDDSTNDFVEGRLFGKYEYAFTEKNKFSQSLEYLQGFDDKDNYLINSETALIAALNSYLALKLSYIVNYNNQPSSDTPDDTDTTLVASIVVNY